ncbi:MAG TPA: GNAT family N-acetyltransferase [Candidatus Eisenbacteria bacterium]|nr:GNAT family N-acetyltransferase [Candidatus Eisenbacteria bacterium]
MELRTARLVLRPWNRQDEAALVRHANNRNIWIRVGDRFPHPYTRKDARRWLKTRHHSPYPPTNFAITLEGEAIGGVGFERKRDLARMTAEVGYWLSEMHWGKGYATEVVQAIAQYAFERFDFVRLEARVLEGNAASSRVLEKAGFSLETTMRQAGFKDGRVLDMLLYARLKPVP